MVLLPAMARKFSSCKSLRASSYLIKEEIYNRTLIILNNLHVTGDLDVTVTPEVTEKLVIADSGSLVLLLQHFLESSGNLSPLLPAS